MKICDTPSNWALLEDQTVKMVLGLDRAHNHLREQNSKFVAGYGLTWGQFATLSALRQIPPPHRLLPSQLYGPVQVTSGGMSKILDGLQEKGFICREENPKDRRGKFATLTEAGFSHINMVAEALKNELGKSLAGKLTHIELADFSRLIERFCQSFEPL